MLKLILFAAALTLSQLTIADADKGMGKQPVMDMSAINQAHASIKTGDAKDQPFWSKDQLGQSELEKKYKKEIAANPENKKAYAYLAGLYLTNNKTLEAIGAYQDAITHDPENPKLFAAISIAYLHQSKYAMAKAMAAEALRLKPDMKQVEKINEYIAAKQAAIEAASKVPATGKSTSMKGMAPHGSVMSAVTAEKPLDMIHNPEK
jgi:tetratricopeptide (TPR) repeat protein